MVGVTDGKKHLVFHSKLPVIFESQISKLPSNGMNSMVKVADGKKHLVFPVKLPSIFESQISFG